MRYTQRLCLLSVLVLLAGVTVADEAGSACPVVEGLAQRFLLKDCGTGDELPIERLILAAGISLEPDFIDALEKGPDPELLELVERSLDERFTSTRKLLEKGESGLTEEQRKRRLAVKREDYIAGESQDFVVAYKSRAIVGLGLVGGEKARAVLQPIASDPDSPLRFSAQWALEQIEKPESATRR
jgi:hypothetical protein